MSTRLKWLIAVFAAFAFLITACGSDSDESSSSGGGGDGGGEGSIWVLLPDSSTSDRWEKDDRRFFKASFEDAGLVEGEDFNIVNAEGDAETQISQAEQAIGDDASVIVLTSNDSGSGATIIDMAKEADVAVVEYDRFNVEGSAGGDVYVSFDNELVGATMAETLEPLIDETGADPARVVMLNGGPTDNNATLFRNGYAETAEARAEAGDWEIVADEAVPDWDNQNALDIFEQILVDAENDVNGVFAANDGLASSVITALESANLDPTTIPVSGQDATEAGIQNVLLGKQAMSVYKPIELEASVAAEAALALRAGEDVTGLTGEFEIIGIDAEGSPTASPDEGVPYIALVPIAVTADNVEETVIADGFRTWDELCVDDVAALYPDECA